MAIGADEHLSAADDTLNECCQTRDRNGEAHIVLLTVIGGNSFHNKHEFVFLVSSIPVLKLCSKDSVGNNH